jgi:hypothetical protein
VLFLLLAVHALAVWVWDGDYSRVRFFAGIATTCGLSAARDALPGIDVQRRP